VKEHVRELGTEQPFRTDIAYYEGRAAGIATVDGVGVAEARLDLAQRHGFTSWALLSRHVAALRDGTEPPTPFMLAYRAVEDNDKDGLVDLLDGHPELVEIRGTNGNDLLGMAGSLEIVRLLLERGADPNRGNDHGEGVTALHLAAQAGRRAAVEALLELGADPTIRDGLHDSPPSGWAEFGGHQELTDFLREASA